MKTFQIHISEWEMSTRHLSLTERAIYMELLTVYYRTETPVLRSYIDRITKVYTPEEKRALEFVLSQFFTEENGAYKNAHCEAEIEAWQQKSAKAKASIARRWARASREEKKQPKQSNIKSADTNVYTNVCTNVNTNVCTNVDTNVGTDVDTDVLPAKYEGNTDVILNNIYKDIYKEKEKEIFKEKAKESTDDSLVLTSEPMPAETAPKVIPEGDVVVTSTESKGKDDGRKDNSLSYVTVSKERRRIPFKKIMATFNEVIQGTRLDQAMSLEDSRKRTIAARISELVKVKPIDNDDDLLRELRSIFQKVVKDPWYLGNNQYGYVITFTDIFSPKNFTRFLERSENYQPRAQARPQRPERRSNAIQPLPNPADFSLEDA